MNSTDASSTVFMLGFGSQGAAWAECLRESGRDVRVYLAREGASYARARALAFTPRPTAQLQADLSVAPVNAAAILVFATPDDRIGALYRENVAGVARACTLVLIHGYAVFSGDLKPAQAEHAPALLAPKAIGPKLRAAYFESPEHRHERVAGFHAPEGRRPALLALARDLGFRDRNLVEASFEKEAVGDLISEQGLLCGGVFTLLEWTMDAMARAGCPDALIREECLTELELIAGMIRERGPASTFGAISQAAQAGTIAMHDRFVKSGFRAQFDAQVDDVLTHRFDEFIREGSWKSRGDALRARLQAWQDRLDANGKSPGGEPQ